MANNKRYQEQFNIGRVRYAVSYHDGTKQHRDGSPFYDLHISRNKRDHQRFIRALTKAGYTRE